MHVCKQKQRALTIQAERVSEWVLLFVRRRAILAYVFATHVALCYMIICACYAPAKLRTISPMVHVCVCSIMRVGAWNLLPRAARGDSALIYVGCLRGRKQCAQILGPGFMRICHMWRASCSAANVLRSFNCGRIVNFRRLTVFFLYDCLYLHKSWKMKLIETHLKL